MAEVDFTYSPWTDAKFPDIDSEKQTLEFSDRWKLAVGAQYTPKSRGSYLQRVTYRGGGFYENSYIKVPEIQSRSTGPRLVSGCLPPPGRLLSTSAWSGATVRPAPTRLSKRTISTSRWVSTSTNAGSIKTRYDDLTGDACSSGYSLRDDSCGRRRCVQG